MDSSDGIASRTRSRRSREFSEQFGIEFLGESSGKSNEHEIERENRKRKNLSRSVERKTRKKGKTKQNPRGFEIDEEGIEIITQAEFRNTRRSNLAEDIEIESISKDEFLNCKRNDHTKGIKIEIINEDESQDDHAEGDEIVRISEETESRNGLIHDHEEGVEIESNDEEGVEIESVDEEGVEIDSVDEEGVEIESVDEEGVEIEIVDEEGVEIESIDEEGVEIESTDEEGVEIEIINETEFGNSRRRHNNAEEIEVEESCPEEGSSKCRSDKDHKHQHEMNDLEDNDDETNKGSGDSNSDPVRSSEQNNSGSARFQENEMRSQGSGHEPDLCIASRTRSKRDIAKKPVEVDDIVSDSSDGSSSRSDSSPADSWSSYSECDDEDDEDFIVENSDCSHSMELSSSFIEEGDEERKTKRSGFKEFSDSDDEEECSRISVDALSKVDEDDAEAEVQNLQGNSKGTASNIGDRRNVEREDLVRSSMDSNQMFTKKKHEERKVVDNIHSGREKVTSSTDTKSSGVAKVTGGEGKESANRYEDTKSSGVAKTTGEKGKEPVNRHDSREILQREGKRMKSHEANDKLSCKNEENAEDGDRTKFDTHDHCPRKGCARNEEVIDEKTEQPTRRRLCQRKDNDLCGKKKKSHEHENKENAEDGDRMKFDTHDHSPRKECARNKEVIDMFGKTERPTSRRSRPQKDHDLCKNLLDAVLDEGTELGDSMNNEQVKKSAEYESTLPLRFRFEDEDTRPVEKSELEVLIESLLDEMELCLKYGDVDISGYQEVETDNANCPDVETNQYALCCKGRHYLIQDDELGLICLYCLHIELEARYVIPPWAKKTCRGADRRLSGDEQASVLDGLNLEQDENFTGCDLSTGTIWDIKPGIRETMYEHQQEGLEFLWKNLAGTMYLNELETTDSSNIGGCIISHAPGTGKTRLTIVFIETYLKLFPNCHPLIIAPASMLLTWEDEFRKWEVKYPFHNLNNLEMSGKEDKIRLENLQEGKSLNKDVARAIKIYSWNKERSVLGMSYRLFELLAGKKSKNKLLRTILLEKTGLVVLDEGHTPRSRKSNIWNTLLELNTKKRIILSGTPFQNNFEELFNILRIVRPAIAGDLAKERVFAEMITSKALRLRKKYRNDDEEHQEATTNHAIEELKAAMAPFVHVHKGTILQQSLPGLRDCVVLLKPPPLQKSLIRRIEGSQGTFKFDHKVALISVHPYLFKHCLTTENERKGVDLDALEASRLNPIEGAKTRYVMELVRLSAVRNERVLIFSQYIKPLALIQRHLKKIFGWTKGKHILKMEGEMGQKKRQDLINMFNDSKSEAKVLLASTKCCSEGINLVGASRVVLLDVVWNPSVERQAISRAYRLGQKKIVYTYHLMTSGTTEGDKYCRQAEKERLSELVFTSSSNETSRVKSSDIGIEDDILEDMVENGSLKDMFEKIIYQPKEKKLMDTFSIAD